MFRLNKLDKLCRRYDSDLWNQCFLLGKATRLALFLGRKRIARRTSPRVNPSLLRIDVEKKVQPRRRLSAFGKLLETRKKLCFFYGGLSKRKYRSLNYKASYMKGNYNYNMLLLLESLLCSIVYRMNFAGSILESLTLVLSGGVMVNKKIIKDPYYVVEICDVIEVTPDRKERTFNFLVNQLRSRNVLVPKYCEINYSILCGSLVRVPRIKEVPFGFRFGSQFFFSEFTGKL